MLLTTNTLLLIEFIIYTIQTLYLMRMQLAIHEQICWSRSGSPKSQKIRNSQTDSDLSVRRSLIQIAHDNKWPKYLTLAARSRLAKSKTLNRRPFGDFPIFIGTFANRDFARLSCIIVLKFDVRLLIREKELFYNFIYGYEKIWSL